jgi:phosphate transport system substrate-binding protein
MHVPIKLFRPHFLIAPLLLLAGCSKQGGPESASPGPVRKPADTAPPGANNVDLQGAGATFPYPLYSKWVAEYQKLEPTTRINYQSIGSGGGIRQIAERTVDFGATDAPMTEAELAKLQQPILHLPMTLGAVVLAYNVTGVTDLKLTAELIAGIFAGEIKSWDDAKIKAVNPSAKLPHEAISVTYRSDGSGTTAVFTEYLSKISPAWASKVGAGKSVKFPAGLGAKGNEGVAGQLKTTPFSIGYLELAYAKQTGTTYATLRNQAGKFVEPSLQGISAAAASVGASLPDDMRVSIVNAPGEDAYPISAFTYLLVYQQQADPVKGKALAKFLWWAIHEGQRMGPPLYYATVPAEIVTKVEAKLKTLKAGDQALLPSS